MKIELNIIKRYSELSRQNYLCCDISINGNWLKQIVMDGDDLNSLLSIIPDSLEREELTYSEHDRCDHDPECDCQFNPNYEVKGVRLASESCSVHNYNPINIDDQLL